MRPERVCSKRIAAGIRPPGKVPLSTAASALPLPQHGGGDPGTGVPPSPPRPTAGSTPAGAFETIVKLEPTCKCCGERAGGAGVFRRALAAAAGTLWMASGRSVGE